MKKKELHHFVFVMHIYNVLKLKCGLVSGKKVVMKQNVIKVGKIFYTRTEWLPT